MGDKVLSVSGFLLYGLGLILLVPHIHGVTREFHYVNMSLTWTDAQQYCREHFTDLATVESADDLNRMNKPPEGRAWIGLHDDPAAWYQVMTSDANSWRWSSTGTTSPGGYQNWASNEPNKYGGRQSCVFIQDNLWQDYLCSSPEYCLCYTGQLDGKQFFLMKDIKRNWMDCQSVCREYYHDLAMIESEAEDTAAMEAMAGERTAWIGLYRHIWIWSDLSNSSFKNWNAGEPNGFDQHCVSTYDDDTWDDYYCTRLLPFICHKVTERSVSKAKIKFQTDLDMSDPYIRQQLLKLLEERLKEENNNADFKLRWTTPPTKQEKKSKKPSYTDKKQ